MYTYKVKFLLLFMRPTAAYQLEVTHHFFTSFFLCNHLDTTICYHAKEVDTTSKSN